MKFLFLMLIFVSHTSFAAKAEGEKISKERERAVISTLYSKFVTDESECGETDTSTDIVSLWKIYKTSFTKKDVNQYAAILDTNFCSNPPQYFKGVFVIIENDKIILSDKSQNFSKILNVTKSPSGLDEIQLSSMDQGKKKTMKVQFLNGKIKVQPL